MDIAAENKETKKFTDSQIRGSQVTLLEAIRYDRGPLILVKMQISEAPPMGARYDLGKLIFIDWFPDKEVMYQLRRTELTVGARLCRLFKI